MRMRSVERFQERELLEMQTPEAGLYPLIRSILIARKKRPQTLNSSELVSKNY